jgi:hypothetical protein
MSSSSACAFPGCPEKSPEYQNTSHSSCSESCEYLNCKRDRLDCHDLVPVTAPAVVSEAPKCAEAMDSGKGFDFVCEEPALSPTHVKGTGYYLHDFKPLPSSAEPSGEQRDPDIVDWLLDYAMRWPQGISSAKAAKAALEIKRLRAALSTAPQAKPSEVTDAMVDAAMWQAPALDPIDRINMREAILAALKAGSKS